MSKNILYDAFQRFDLAGNKCFLTGELIDREQDFIYVFPEFIMQEFDLYDKPFKLLDENYCQYQDLTLPCSQNVKKKIEALNAQVQDRLQNGNLTDISELQWFQFASLIMIGLVYKEIKHGYRSDEYKEEGFKISPALIQKFRNAHFFAQSILHSFEWDDPKPFSCWVFQLEDQDPKLPVFEHRNEINTLTFSMKYHHSAIILCLQDQESNKWYWQKNGHTLPSTLSEIQFAEFSARVYYSNYLCNLLPDYDFVAVQDRTMALYKENAPVRQLFKDFEVKTYVQVLEAFLKPWGYSKIELYKSEHEARSFLM